MLAGLPFDYSGLSPFCFSSFPLFFPPLCAVALFVRHVIAGLARSSLQQSWDHEKGRSVRDHEKGRSVRDHEKGRSVRDHEKGRSVRDHVWVPS
jgi:hypothetical protein